LLSREADVEAHALRARGWTISAIARHVGADRKTVRGYLSGVRTPGVRVSSADDPFAGFESYCRIRLHDDPHLWAVTLYDELCGLGYVGGYSTFTRALRGRRLRPHCEPCAASRGRDHAVIAHAAGEETLCGTPHKVSYAVPGNMRREPFSGRGIAVLTGMLG
jgi:hypothetical protein